MSDGVYLYYNGADGLRAQGYLEFQEAFLTFDGLSKDHKESLVKLLTLLQDGRGVDTEHLPNGENLTQVELQQVTETLDAALC